MERTVRWEIDGELIEAGLVFDQADIDACYRMRYDEYVVRHPMVEPSLCPDGREIDAFDAHSWHILAKHGDIPVGTFRLIDCAKGCLLDGTTWSGIPFQYPKVDPLSGATFDVSACVEGSRFVAHSVILRSGTRVLVSMLVMKAVMEACAALGKRWLLGSVNARVVANLASTGWKEFDIIPGVHFAHDTDLRVVMYAVATDYPDVRMLSP